MTQQNTSQNAVNSDNFKLNLGEEFPEKRGEITSDKLESRSFGETYEYQVTTKADLDTFISDFKNVNFTSCFEGPLVKLWYDSEGNRHFSNLKKLNCSNSYWGDKTKRFGDLFTNYGGLKFEEVIPKTKHLTHHFMLIENTLMVTSRETIYDNDCVVVYLGSVDLEGKKFNLDYDDSIFYQSKYFVNKETLQNRILYPKNMSHEEAQQKLLYTNKLVANNYQWGISESNKELCVSHLFKGENIMLFADDKIYKLKHKASQLREYLAGNTPNVKNRLYVLLDSSKKKFTDYNTVFPYIGIPTDEELKLFKKMSHVAIETYVVNVIHQRLEFTILKDPKNVEQRSRNILLTFILSTTLHRSQLLIDYWFDYKKIKNDIANVIIKKSNETTNFTDIQAEESIISFNKKGIDRLKDLSNTCKNYARTTKNDKPYMYNLKFSLYGLLNNEYGSSLYRIEKSIHQLHYV